MSKRNTCNIDILNSVQDIVFTDLSFILCIQNMVHTTLLRLLSCWAQHTQHLPADSKRFNPKEKELMISVFLDPETIKSIPDNVNEAIFRMKAWLQKTLIYRLLALLGEVIFEESQLCVLDFLTDLENGCRMGMMKSS